MSDGIDEIEAARAKRRRLLPSGYRWVVLQAGGYAHMLNVEHHWKPDNLAMGGVRQSTFDYNEPMSPRTECGVSTEGGDFHITMMSAYEGECCATCWKLALR